LSTRGSLCHQNVVRAVVVVVAEVAVVVAVSSVVGFCWFVRLPSALFFYFVFFFTVIICWELLLS